MVDSLIKEIEMTSDYLPSQQLTSIYFGGGTPSLLEARHIDSIFQALQKVYNWDEGIEITLEANPDDITSEKVKYFSSAGINRWSLGVQSFHQVDLDFMNRAHNSQEAIKSIDLILNEGQELSIDLIYGSPTTHDEMWAYNLEKAFSFPINHISAYALTVEEGTALHHFIKKGNIVPSADDKISRQFTMIMEHSKRAGFEHYEISNYARNGKIGVHNNNYWMGVPYLGIGPAAHSYIDSARRWNVSNNAAYIKAINEAILPFTEEKLSPIDLFNERIMVQLRTKWGIPYDFITHSASQTAREKLNQFIAHGWVKNDDKTILLTDKGKHFADRIAMELFIV